MPDVDSLIVTLRGQQVLLDFDPARIYGVPTFRFNEAVKRNGHRFPPDFCFQLTGQEWAAVQSLRSQHVIWDTHPDLNSSQIAMSAARHRGAAYRPWAFTDHGAMMAANVLNSDRAVEMRFCRRMPALEGGPNAGVRFAAQLWAFCIALTGLDLFLGDKPPGALPWAIILRPVGAGNGGAA
jgi:hypothetical protein